ncbi:MAG: FAD:protein FMN transferase [Bacteroidales bacterium]|nr:FAD:protein FMN transferase [Bacteroidales bacterium]
MKYLYILIIPILLISCQNKGKKEYRFYEGPIQGTTFHITYEWDTDLSKQIDSLLQVFNKSLSNFDPNSNISKINKNETDKLDPLSSEMLKTARMVYEKTNGAFDVTAAPVINAWGFGWTGKINNIIPDSLIIDSLMQFVGMHKIQMENLKLIKNNENTMIVTNAIAKGLSVDYVSDYFLNLGLENFLVEIGGEIYCSGQNQKGQEWRIGIDKPIEGSDENNRENQIIINLSGKAIATSGNYRRYVEEGKVKFGHSIDPRTGYPALNSILSVSVIGENCMLCDAFATGFMVEGLEKSIQITESIDNLEAYFIYIDKNNQENTAWSSGFDKHVLK